MENNLYKITEVSYKSKAEEKKVCCDRSDTVSFFEGLNRSIDEAERNNEGDPRLVKVYVKVEEKRLESIKTEKSSLLEESANEGKQSVYDNSINYVESSMFGEEKSSVKDRKSEKKEMNESKEKRVDRSRLVDDSYDINNISHYYSNFVSNEVPKETCGSNQIIETNLLLKEKNVLQTGEKIVNLKEYNPIEEIREIKAGNNNKIKNSNGLDPRKANYHNNLAIF